MKHFKFLLLAFLVCAAGMVMPGSASGQTYDIGKTGISIDHSSSDFKYTAGTNVIAVATVHTVTAAWGDTTGTDTVKVKLSGGTKNNAIHWWFPLTRTAGKMDSFRVTLYGIVADSKTPSTNTVYKAIYVATYSDATTEQINETVTTGNDYTGYMVVTRKYGKLQGTATGKYLALVR